MKKYILFIIITFMAFAILPACHRGSGCPAADLEAKTNKKGEFKKSKGPKSGLFPKNMRKKM